MTPQRMFALIVGPLADNPDDEATLEALYWRFRDRLLADVASPRMLPWGWWEYEGPPELREGRLRLIDADDHDGQEKERRRLDELATARAAWLARAGGRAA